MRPGQWSQAGFLGNAETLADVIAQDEQTLERLGVTHAQIASALDHLLDAATEAYQDRQELSQEYSWGDLAQLLKQGALPPEDKGVRLGDHQVFLQVYAGYQFCPWTVIRRPWSVNKPGTPVRIEYHDKEVYIITVNGLALPCQGGMSYRYGDSEFVIINRASKEYVWGPGLIVHLIRDHRFFEGTQTPYRVDPEQVARVLGLV